jgi:glycosyltransferase involved in cell wall biosynthesis
MRATPTVTVLMPVHNGRRFLLAAVRSIQQQTFGDFELLIIDDGSDDGSQRLLNTVRDPRLRVVRQEHAGIVAGLNRGLDEARGELVARMDADDLAMENRLALQVDYLQRHPEVHLLGTRIQYIDGRGRPLFCPASPCEDGEIRRTLPTANCFTHPTVMFRRKSVLAVGGYRPELTLQEDYDLWLRLTEQYRVAQLPQVLLLYRLWHGSFTHCNRFGMCTVWDEVVKELARQRRSAGQDQLQATGSLDSLRQRLESEISHWTRRRRWGRYLVRLGQACLDSDRRMPALGFAAEAICYDPLSSWQWNLLLRCAMPDWLRECTGWMLGRTEQNGTPARADAAAGACRHQEDQPAELVESKY